MLFPSSNQAALETHDSVITNGFLQSKSVKPEKNFTSPETSTPIDCGRLKIICYLLPFGDNPLAVPQTMRLR